MPPTYIPVSGLHGVDAPADIVGDLNRHAGEDLESLAWATIGATGEPFVEMLAVGRHAVGTETHRQPSVGQLGGDLRIERTTGRDPDLDVRIRMHDRLQRLALTERTRPAIRQLDLLAVVGDRLFAREHFAHDGDVVAHALGRLAPRHAVPTLDDLRAGQAETDDDAIATGQRVDGHRVHRGGRRGARRDLHDRGAELDPLRQRREIRQRRQCVAAVRLRGPHGMKAQLFCPLDLGDRHIELCATVEIETQPKFH